MNSVPYVPSRLVPTNMLPGAVDPRPPFQVRGVQMLYLEGRVDPGRLRPFLPDWLKPSDSGSVDIAIYTAPESGVLGPISSSYVRIALADYLSPDGGSAVFTVAEAMTARAAAVLSRHYSANWSEGTSALTIEPDTICGQGELGDGAMVSMRTRRTHGPVTATAGSYPEVGRNGDSYIEFTCAYSCLIEPVVLEDLRFSLPRGHRLEELCDHFQPVEVGFLHEKSFALGVPRPATMGQIGPSDAAPALIDLLGRLNLPALVFRMDGRLAHVSLAAERLGPDLDKVVRLIRDKAFLQTPSATHQDRHLPLTLQDGQTEVIRLIPLAPALWGGPAVLCVLADLSRLAKADPAPVLGLVGLTPAEARIAARLAKGGSAQVVAAELGLSPHTVRSALKVIYSKLAITGRAELASLVERLIGISL